jgi:hypothetical protein
MSAHGGRAIDCALTVASHGRNSKSTRQNLNIGMLWYYRMLECIFNCQNHTRFTLERVALKNHTRFTLERVALPTPA